MLTGECRGCTNCCTHIALILPTQPDAVEWAKARGFILTQQNERVTEFWVPSVCPYLKSGKCELHGDKKPVSCRDFPGSMIATWNRVGLDPNICMGSDCGFRYSPEES